MCTHAARRTRIWSRLLVVLCSSLIAGVPAGGSAQDEPQRALRPDAETGQSAALPTPPPRWCDSDRRWMEKAASLGLPNPRGGCPTNGPCDDASMRDSYIPSAATPLTTIKLVFVIFREDDQSNRAVYGPTVQAQMDQLNSDFAPYRVFFESWQVLIDSTQYRHLDEDEIDGMKLLGAYQPDNYLNIFVTEFNPELAEQISGRATFPWDPDALTDLGGIIIDKWSVGEGMTLLSHEIGHALGLWHTHHNVDDENDDLPSTMLSCSHDCRDRAGSSLGNTRGDFCSDTPPTPRNENCGPPGGTDPCNGVPWGPTQPQNFMGYAPYWPPIN